MLKFLLNLFSPPSSTPMQSAPPRPPVAGAGALAGAGDERQRFNRRARYIRTQALQLAERFSKDGGSGIELDEQNYNWLIIPRYPMPERWKQRWTRVTHKISLIDRPRDSQQLKYDANTWVKSFTGP